MTMKTFTSVTGGTVDIDLCFACRGLWFDPQENMKLAPIAVVELFGLLHEHRQDEVHPLASKLACPRCHRSLVQGFDVVRSGRYITYRCPQRHGRLSTFSSFMIEKGFVRQLTKPEIDDIAQRVAVIYCSGCGAPVDIRKDHACPHCRSALSLLDPQAVEQALKGYAKAVQEPQGIKPPELADALMMIERDRSKAEREEQARRGTLFTSSSSSLEVDLWATGVDLVWRMLR